ncbi:ATP-binding protein [Kitasatospora herbaricolor]|uniref:ATP-binding protein n=1 Tax=Kitasatospora herbaricolor TaxID=68217 RepID=UPI0009A10D48
MEQISGAAEPGARRPGAGPVEGVWRISVLAQESSVPRTRHAVRDRLLAQGMAGWRYQELIDDLLLIVSELVSNAVTHAAVLSPQVTTELTIGGGSVRVSVEDGHPYRPKALESDLGQLGGRGLLLVKSVTLQAGGVCDVERTAAGGKVIWASLPLPEPAADEEARPPEEQGRRPQAPEQPRPPLVTATVQVLTALQPLTAPQPPVTPQAEGGSPALA